MEIHTYEAIDRSKLHAKPIQYKITDKGCWECVSHSINVHGYVSVTINFVGYRLHRLVYELENGVIDEGNVIMHTCDNRACFNPSHLVQGTQYDNVMDMVNKSRGTPSKISDREVWEIKYFLTYTKYSQHEIASLYNVSQSLIARIKTGRAKSYIKL